MTVNRDRLMVSTKVGSLDVNYSLVKNVIERLQAVVKQYPDAKLEEYTEYYGGREGSPAIRIMAKILESDADYDRRVKAEEEREANRIAADIAAYERVKALIETLKV